MAGRDLRRLNPRRRSPSPAQDTSDIQSRGQNRRNCVGHRRDLHRTCTARGRRRVPMVAEAEWRCPVLDCPGPPQRSLSTVRSPWPRRPGLASHRSRDYSRRIESMSALRISNVSRSMSPQNAIPFTCERSPPKEEGAHPARSAGRGENVMATLTLALVRCYGVFCRALPGHAADPRHQPNCPSRSAPYCRAASSDALTCRAVI